jgi:capsule polysaccharide export protein KpsE/RkpR
MEEAKTLAQQAHDQARRAISRILEDAKAIARGAHKRAPWATEEYRQRQVEIQRQRQAEIQRKLLGKETAA